MTLPIEQTTSMEDIIENPAKYGAPTFEQYCANREKYLGRKDEILGVVSAGSRVLGNVIMKQEYEISGYKCRTLEEVERVANSEGIPLNELTIEPDLQYEGGNKGRLIVRFVRKARPSGLIA
jgi:hypothetical protein